jgi:hypothetical protein
MPMPKTSDCMGYVLPARPVMGCSPAYDVLQMDRLEPLADGGGGLIRRQQAGVGRRQGRSGGGKFVAEGAEGHGGGVLGPLWHVRDDGGVWQQGAAGGFLLGR